MCLLKNNSAIKEGLNSAHTMETSYKQEFKNPYSNVKAVVPLLRNGFIFRPMKTNWISQG